MAGALLDPGHDVWRRRPDDVRPTRSSRARADGFGNGAVQGGVRGEETITLQQSTIPAHSHVVQGSTTNGNVASPQGSLLAAAPIYAGPTGQQPLISSSVTTVGGTPHENMQPWICVKFCIALVGILPSRN